MQQQKLIIPGPVGDLEALLTQPALSSAKTVSIICHPHPLHEGTMHNKVVTTLAKAFDELGIITVRFNYRGVGQSAGEYGEMLGEIDDLKAVVQWVQQHYDYDALWLAGFSFGSFIAASVANQMACDGLVTVAPAVNHADFTRLSNIQCPWFVIQGDQDEVVPFAEVADFAKHPPAPLQFEVMPGVSHFFHGQLIELRSLLKKLLLA